MPKRLKDYVNKSKAIAHRKRHKIQNYIKGGFTFQRPTYWSIKDEITLFFWANTDRHLALKIKRSVRAIQTKRSKLKRKMKQDKKLLQLYKELNEVLKKL